MWSHSSVTWTFPPFCADWGRPILHFCNLFWWLCAGLREGKLRPLGPRGFQQPVNTQEADLRTPPCYQESVVIQGLRWPHAGLHNRGWSVQLGWWRLWQTRSREQLDAKIPQTYPRATTGKGRVTTSIWAQLDIWYSIHMSFYF